MSKHTKGPWHTEEAKAGGMPYRLEIRGEENETQPFGPCVAVLSWVDEPDICHVHGIEETRANARLMAAAPTLLYALSALLLEAENFAKVIKPYENSEALSNARAAIAQFTGENNA